MERVVFNGFTITANTGTGFDLSGMTASGLSLLYGQAGNETITGTEGRDDIYGGLGADILNGGGNNDDFFVAGAEALGDIYDGGAGTDYIRMTADTEFNAANSFTNITAIVNGGFTMNLAAGETIDFSGMNRSGAGFAVGTASNETYIGFENADAIRAMGGADNISTGNGNDSVYVSGTDSLGDVLDGGAGTDYLRLEADSYFNSANTFTNMERVINGGFDMILDLGTTIDLSHMLRSGAGGIVGSSTADTIIGFSNADVVRGMGGADTISTGDANDSIYVSGTDSRGDILDGGAGTDYLRLEADSYFNSANTFTNVEFVIFNGFNMIVDSGSTVDLSGLLRSGTGQIHGSTGNEDITGMNNNDLLYGFAGDDILRGGNGNDDIYGGADNDVIYDGDGLDDLYGEGGADTFFMESATAFNDIDRVRDFSLAENDAIDITELLTGYTFGVDDLTDFVQILDNGSRSDIYVDTAGTGTFATTDRVATLYSITGITDEVALETSGHLITH
jgi:Ca2+-binding RTX toxin-like protein